VLIDLRRRKSHACQRLVYLPSLMHCNFYRELSFLRITLTSTVHLILEYRVKTRLSIYLRYGRPSLRRLALVYISGIASFAPVSPIFDKIQRRCETCLCRAFTVLGSCVNACTAELSSFPDGRVDHPFDHSVAARCFISAKLYAANLRWSFLSCIHLLVRLSSIIFLLVHSV
jgi:hypothetical protein